MKEIFAGIDVGGTTTMAGLVDRNGRMLHRTVIQTEDYPVLDDFVEALKRMVETLLNEGDYTLKGIGIGAPNGNFNRGTIEMAPNLAWKGVVPLAQMVSERCGTPVRLTNDANAAAIGEMIFGGAKGMTDFVVLTLGTGLGSGIVVNGEVMNGTTGLAGEYGHVIMIPGGRNCGCGRQGCLETYVSATGLVRTVLWLLSEMEDDSPLRNFYPSELTSKDVADAAEKGDVIALQAFDSTAETLAWAIVNIVSVHSPEAVFLFGGLANAGTLLFDPVNRYVDEMIQPVFRGSVKVLPSSIDENNAAIIGSAALAMKSI
ncbi:MAG: ROK family protein [Bacteroidales bacterium]